MTEGATLGRDTLVQDRGGPGTNGSTTPPVILREVPDRRAKGQRRARREALLERTALVAPGRAGPQGASPALLLVSAPSPAAVGASFALDLGDVVIGRSATADIRLDDPGVSREHVRISRGGAGEFLVEDLGSTNGTWLNGVGVRSATLSEGDRLQIGTSTEFLFGVNREGAQAEVRLRQAVFAAGAGTWEWFVASGALQIYGGIARALGHGRDDTEPRAEDAWAHVHSDDREALRARLDAALREPRAFDAEVRLLRPDGTVLRVAMTGEPFRDGEGRPVRFAGALLDVTERRLADAELRRQSLLFDSLADAVVIVGSCGTVLDWSAGAEKLLGWSKAEALGRRPGALLLGSDDDGLDVLLAGCAHDGRRHAGELTLHGKTGADIPVEMVAVPLVPREGDELVACVAVLRDLREQKRLQARLHLAERLASLGTLAAGVAHEINNPLAFVASNLDYLARQLAAAREALGPMHADLAEALADSRKGAERIASIVRDLQVFGGKERPDSPEQAEPNAALEFALRMAASRIRHRARLVRDLNPVPRVAGGEARLGQVFLNLLVNATEAIAPGHVGESVIRVSSRFDPTTQRVVVEVSDQGPGIPPDVLPRIFEPFFTTKPVGAGTGLGLFVCQGIVRELGGELAVESEVGKGTTFRVLLPATEAAPEVPGRRRVLVVDDEPLLGAALRRCFAGRYEVVPVPDPREALERVRSGERYSFAVVDVQMPEMPGEEFLARLRECDPELARRSAVVTGGPLQEAVRRLGEGERPPVLPKPIDLGRLAELIDRVGEARA